MMADDNIKKTMFIVKAKPDSLHTAETWLKGKGGWVIESTDQIKDALPKILAMKPAFIVLCMDHPNQKIRMLPKLFEQALQTKVIAYLEGTSPASLASISGMEYVLYPPITGTAVDRMTSKVDRDRRRKAQMEEQRATSGLGKASLGTTDSGVIAIKGSAHKKEESFAAEQAKKTLMSMAGGDATYTSSGGGGANNASGPMMAKSGGAGAAGGANSVGAKVGGASNNGGSDADAAAALAALANMAKSNDKSKNAKNAKGAENLNGYFGEQNGAAAPEIQGEAEKERQRKEKEKNATEKNATNLNAVNMTSPSAVTATTPGQGVSNDEVEAAVRAMMEDAKKKEAKAKEAGAATAGKELGAKNGNTASNGGASAPDAKPGSSGLAGGIKGFLKKARTLFSRTNEKKGYTETTGIVMGTQKAIDEIAEELPGAPNNPVLPLKNTTQAICFFVTSKNHQGFVLCSIAHNTEPLVRFVDMFKTRLTELMADFDKNFLTSSAMEVTMQQVDFDEWVTAQAAFCKKFVHLDRECGVAFFELAPPKPDTTPSTNKEFVQMKVVDVTLDRKLGFNMFLYLPINKKFILYTRRGGKFAEVQKKRLMDRGIAGVHLYESEVEQMHRTHLEAYLDEMISEHYETKNKKVGVS